MKMKNNIKMRLKWVNLNCETILFKIGSLGQVRKNVYRER